MQKSTQQPHICSIIIINIVNFDCIHVGCYGAIQNQAEKRHTINMMKIKSDIPLFKVMFGIYFTINWLG